MCIYYLVRLSTFYLPFCSCSCTSLKKSVIKRFLTFYQYSMCWNTLWPIYIFLSLNYDNITFKISFIVGIDETNKGIVIIDLVFTKLVSFTSFYKILFSLFTYLSTHTPEPRFKRYYQPGMLSIRRRDSHGREDLRLCLYLNLHVCTHEQTPPIYFVNILPFLKYSVTARLWILFSRPSFLHEVCRHIELFQDRCCSFRCLVWQKISSESDPSSPDRVSCGGHGSMSDPRQDFLVSELLLPTPPKISTS